MPEEQKVEIEKYLWEIANSLRGRMDPSEFKNYILGFIFYKFLSSKIIDFFIEELEVDYINGKEVEEDIEDCIDALGFYIPYTATFDFVISEASEDKIVIDLLSSAFSEIEYSTLGQDSENDFIGLFEDIDLNSSKLGSSVSERNKYIVSVLKSLNKISFKLHETENDVLGDAYEYLISNFASEAGKKAGEFYTPQQVSKLLAKIVSFEKESIQKVYDPTCGSGSLLLRVVREVGDSKYGNIYGQELNRTTFNLARMNMLMHNVRYDRFDIRQGDTLHDPKHLDLCSDSACFDAIVANPPFSLKWEHTVVLKEDSRFTGPGILPPKNKADYAFVEHIIYQLSENGVAAVVLPLGVLFRGGAEEKIRKYLIEELNLLDAVIGLPENIFYGTGIPTVVLVFKKCREDSDILFVNANQEKFVEKKKPQNYMPDSTIEAIMEAYGRRVPIDKFSEVVSLNKIQENDFNLNIPRYVDISEPEEQIDISEVLGRIEELKASESEIDSHLNDYLKELGFVS